MWNRKELKEKGKAAVKRNYWKSVLVSAIFAAAVGGAVQARDRVMLKLGCRYAEQCRRGT